ncbi:hypothetical protein HYH02_005904 [Chlamydomonas schloesseri]|uniref:Major facilitator superfamily (MFS) profile domain-containing protein n=1 Tax=Chlamydomonas schloesseri TaxID=2026947 RepID=A0A835WKB0_9CHLO|nr:hypothetical protein HYH02_005904 [Chlamydomonas schloesseri]|eukprot:KAG2449157.1 hypothetical protein HYH02_005904 [Chlamydomonas schloesseri]
MPMLQRPSSPAALARRPRPCAIGGMASSRPRCVPLAAQPSPAFQGPQPTISPPVLRAAALPAASPSTTCTAVTQSLGRCPASARVATAASRQAPAPPPPPPGSRSAVIACAAGAGGGALPPHLYGARRYGSPANRPQPWQAVAAVCAVAMLLCNFHRSVFTALLPLVADQLALSHAEVGLAQSAMLWGYLAGQIPAGRLSDEHGGDRVLLNGLALWSAATATTAAAAAAANTSAIWVLLGARVAMGAFSSVIMPAVSAACAQWVPAERKAATLAMIYAFFNMGGVLGLVAAPLMAARSGWPGAFITAAAGGVLWSALGSFVIERTGARPLKQAAAAVAGGAAAAPASAAPTAAAAAAAVTAAGGAGAGEVTLGRRETAIQVAALCLCHGVIGWGFFVLQSWLPMYMQSLGVRDLASAGLLSSLPWLAAAFTATLAGGMADRMVRAAGGEPGRRLEVRRVMHTVSTLGCAAAMLPLAAGAGLGGCTGGVGGGCAGGGALPPLVATACLVAAVGCYGFSFGGFHAYVQDVASADAGALLGITNTASILGGIAGNIATGLLVQATGGYEGVFLAAACLYGLSWAVFMVVLRGQPIRLRALGLGLGAGGGGGGK